MATPTIYKGDDATVYISGLKHDVLAISDFSLTLSKGTAEQELIGSKGNYSIAGAMSCEGSLTACKLHATAVSKLVQNMVGGGTIQVSGNCGANSLYWNLISCQVTGFDFSIGTADEITEGTIDYTSLIPYRIRVSSSSTTTHLSDCEPF